MFTHFSAHVHPCFVTLLPHLGASYIYTQLSFNECLIGSVT